MAKIKLLFLALVVGALVACASTQPDVMTEVPSPLPSVHTDSLPQNGGEDSVKVALQEQPYLITAQQGIVMTVGGETASGCYSLDTYPDGTADIIYYDYESEMCVRLSENPNMGHDPASTAYIPSFKGGARCFVSGDNLYVIKNGQPYTDPNVEGNDPTARLYCMDLDGSNRKVLEYGTNLAFQWDGGVAGDKKGNLYTVLLIVDPDGTETTYVLAKLGRDIENYEVLYSWPESIPAKLAGVCDNGFIIQLQDISTSETKTSLVLVQNEGYAEPLLEWSNVDITSYTIYDNILYYTKNGDTSIYAQNIVDGSPSIKYAEFDYQNYKADLVLIRCEVRDNHLIVQYAGIEEAKSLYAALDLLTGEFVPLNLYYGNGDEKTLVGIFAEGKNDFLVCVGTFTRLRTDYGLDGTPYKFEQRFEDYVLISKSDYWENIPSYRQFQYYE